MFPTPSGEVSVTLVPNPRIRSVVFGTTVVNVHCKGSGPIVDRPTADVNIFMKKKEAQTLPFHQQIV
jgi:hypothetical protein